MRTVRTTPNLSHKPTSLFDASILVPAIGDAFKKLDPRLMVKNPVMFVTLVGAVLTTVSIFTAKADRGFIIQLAVWLWFTVLFANFAEAVAEGRGKAQAASLRAARKDTMARRLKNGARRSASRAALGKRRPRRLRNRRCDPCRWRSHRRHRQCR
jgi:K+-transporting ATPase ATPase B chain